MSGCLDINVFVFIQKSLECSSSDGSRMAPSAFPILERAEFGRKTRTTKKIDRLILAEVIRLPPGLEPANDRSWSHRRNGFPALRRKKPVERCSGHRLRRRPPSLPLLKSAELYGQPTVHKRTDRLRLTETLGHAPSFQFYDYRVKRLLGHQTVYHGGSPFHWQLVAPQILTMRSEASSTISYLPIV